MEVGAIENALGLLCLYQATSDEYNSKSLSASFVVVGNPLLENWRTIQLSEISRSEYFIGFAMRHKVVGNFFAYKLFGFISKDSTFIRVVVFDSETGLWSCKKEWNLRSCSFMLAADGSKAYIATDSCVKMDIATYDMDSEELEGVNQGVLVDKGGWDNLSNHSIIDPTLVVCRGSLYVIGRTSCHRFLRVWKLVADKMICISEYFYNASNTTILFASDGNHKIIARTPGRVIEYHIESNEWSSYGSNEERKGGKRMFSGHKHRPCKPHIVKAIHITRQAVPCQDGSLLWLISNSSVRALELPRSCDCKPAEGALLKELGLICVPELRKYRALVQFPARIYIGSTDTYCWEEIPNITTFAQDIQNKATKQKESDEYSPFPCEFIGITLKQQQQAPRTYFLYYFFLETVNSEESNVHVHRYNSLTKSWDVPIGPCKVDARSYGWHCSVSGPSSSCRDKIYLSSIQFYRGKVPEGVKGWRLNNKMRVIAYDSVNNVWDDIFPKDGVLSPTEPDGRNKNVRSSMVACGGRLFVVGRSLDIEDTETVEIWEVKDGEGTSKLVTTIKARAWQGCISLCTDGVSKIFVNVMENEDSLETSRVMEYDLGDAQWTCYPIEENIWGLFAE
ncbi:hypothetical protein SELMODRAFT_429795 [Selaginella moellendorffii]|uniref:F-box protein At3g26010-like beta-propeller domain-containing protein n=1 Tax=Selaginella moellendorffii TaxID=88036 RepID=D8T7B9_SELML|nr:hypothetical protein SELMODRAFT_429795 [Selaginella moellendorffii]